MGNRKGGNAAARHMGAPAPKRRSRRALRVLGALAVAVAIALVVSTFFVRVLEVRGSTMEPTLSSGSYAFVLRGSDFARGDIAAFEYDNKVLVKRVVAVGGDVVEIKSDGTAFVNGEELQERYATYLHAVAGAGEGEGLEYPYTVPDGSYFVLGDDRADNSDSRNPEIAALSHDSAIGRVVFVF